MSVVRVVIVAIGLMLVAYSVIQVLPTASAGSQDTAPTLGKIATGVVQATVALSADKVPALNVRRAFVAGHTPDGDAMQFQTLFVTGEDGADPATAAATTDAYLAFHADQGFAPLTPGADPFITRSIEQMALPGVSLPRQSQIVPESCVATGPASVAFGGGIFLRDPTVCRIASSRTNGRDALVGMVWPEEAALPLDDGLTLCAEEVRSWFEMDAFRDVAVAACLLVDQPQLDRGLDRFAGNWADVLVFQRGPDDLVTLLAAEARNTR